MKSKRLTIIGVLLCTILFVECSPSPESSGKKLAQQVCDCQKEYAKTQDKIYQEFLGKFDSYGFKTRTEARQKWQEINDEAAKQLEQCKAEVEQRVKEAKSKIPTSVGDLLDPNLLQKAVSNPKGYAKELKKKQKEFAKNQEKAKKFDEAYRSVINQCSEQKTEKDNSALEEKILKIIPPLNVDKLKSDLIRRRIVEQANGYYGRGWSWQINSPDEIKSMKIEKEEKVGDDYLLDVHLLLEKDANQHEADLKITCVLRQQDDWTIDFIETKDIHIVKTGRYDNCITTEIKKAWGTTLQFTNSCDVKLIVGGEILGNNDEWTKFSNIVNANSTSSVSYYGKEYKIDFIERQ